MAGLMGPGDALTKKQNDLELKENNVRSGNTNMATARNTVFAREAALFDKNLPSKFGVRLIHGILSF
jgi:hypothetical protein